ncbi:MAG: class I SAM-dependent methyltransferase [Draconibacterium sp.]|nr:class I SAM-dependent methyltransferase [Draconibacterium sp.]
MVESGIFYGTVVDPLLTPLRKYISREIFPGEKIIDIACGTGAQICETSKIVVSATGVDLSKSMIKYAKKQSEKKNLKNVYFYVSNATNLSEFADKSFDTALMSLALHQFSPELHPAILNEMKRLANKIILVDYAVPLPKNYSGLGSRVAEFLAGKDHNRNFKQYCRLGGLNQILTKNNLTINKSQLFAKGAFQLLVCSSSI